MPTRCRKKKKLDRRGRAPLKETIKCSWTTDGKIARFTVSEDMAQMLATLHLKAFGPLYWNEYANARYDPTTMIRIQMLRLDDMGLNAVYMRCEPPTFNPKGARMWKAKHGRRYYVQIKASTIGVKDSMPTVTLDMLYDPNQSRAMGGGLILTFPDEYMIKDLT